MLFGKPGASILGAWGSILAHPAGQGSNRKDTSGCKVAFVFVFAWIYESIFKLSEYFLTKLLSSFMLVSRSGLILSLKKVVRCKGRSVEGWWGL